MSLRPCPPQPSQRLYMWTTPIVTQRHSSPLPSPTGSETFYDSEEDPWSDKSQLRRACDQWWTAYARREHVGTPPYCRRRFTFHPANRKQEPTSEPEDELDLDDE